MVQSLCRSKGAGEEVEVLVEQMPAEICIDKDLVYFINASDRQTLYCIGTDERNLTKLGDFPMQSMILLEGCIYFLSVYDREEDPFYQLTEEKVGGDRYLYSVNLDGSDCRLLVAKVCKELATDGVQLYYVCREEEESILYKNSMDGEKEEVIWQGEERISNLVSYQGRLYGCINQESTGYFSQLEKMKNGKF